MPHYSPDAVLDPDSAVCPIVGLAIDTRAHASDWHMHRRTQLLYQAEGGVTLFLPDRVGQLAPLQAAWLPAGCSHRTAMHGSFAYRSLYFDVQAYPGLPVEPLILDVNPLLRALILRVTEWSADAVLSLAQTRIVETLLDELAAAPTAPMPLPMPRDRRLAPIAKALLLDPACPLSLADWGGGGGRQQPHAGTVVPVGNRAVVWPLADADPIAGRAGALGRRHVGHGGRARGGLCQRQRVHRHVPPHLWRITATKKVTPYAAHSACAWCPRGRFLSWGGPR